MGISRKRQGQLGRAWYTGAHYKQKQPFKTYLLGWRGTPDPTKVSFIASEIRGLVPNPQKATALEIGPGEIPVSALVPFRRLYFMDRSPAIVKGLAKTKLPVPDTPPGQSRVGYNEVGFRKLVGKRARLVVGDIQNLPFGNVFDIVVMNEVLTHLRPRERLKALRVIADHAKSILLIERPQRPLRQMREEARKIHEQNLRHIDENNKGAEILTSKIKDNMSTAQRRKEQATFVNFPPLIRFLRQNGWKVGTTEGKGIDNQRRIILKATRKK